MTQWILALLATLLLALEPSVCAQELKPRAYWPAPTDTNLISLALGNTSGDVVTDPSLPIDNANSSLDFAQLSFYRSFGLAGRTASVLVAMPYFRGTVKGEVDGIFRSRYLSGLGDVQLRLALNLAGAPAMDRSEFAQLLTKLRPMLGMSLQVQAPTGGLRRAASDQSRIQPLFDQTGYRLHPTDHQHLADGVRACCFVLW